jgi:hypothetical protein
VRERRKEPRKGSEIDPETACIQTVGAPALTAFGFFAGRVRGSARDLAKDIWGSEMDPRPRGGGGPLKLG